MWRALWLGLRVYRDQAHTFICRMKFKKWRKAELKKFGFMLTIHA